MGTMATQWAQLVSQMGAQADQALVGGMNANTQAKLAATKQQLADQENQRQQLQAQQWDQAWHEHMMDMRALPVVNGMVKESVPMPPLAASILAGMQPPGSGGTGSPGTDSSGTPGAGGASSTPSDDPGNLTPASTVASMGPSAQVMQAMQPAPAQGNLTIMRKADPSRIAKHVDATGQTASYEIPTPEQQKAYQLQDLIDRARAQGQGQAAGTPMVATDPGYNSRNNLPAGMAQIPESGAVQLAERTVPATIRGNTQLAVTDKNVAGRQGVADTRAQTASDAQDLKDQQFQDLQDQKERFNAAADATKRWLSTQTTGRQKLTQDAVNARSFLDNFQRNTQAHTTLSKNILAENQKQLGVNNILGADASGQPNTPDGTSFNDPFNGGKPTVMNAAQRLILGQRSAASQKFSTDMLGTKTQLENMRDGLLQKIGGAAPAGGGSPAPTAAPNPTAGAAQTPSPTQPRTWAHAARAESGPAAALPGRAAPTPTPAAQTPAPAAQSMKPPSRGAQLPANIAARYVQQAGGDKNKARALAAGDGWKF
jgi:hypothetical protein